MSHVRVLFISIYTETGMCTANLHSMIHSWIYNLESRMTCVRPLEAATRALRSPVLGLIYQSASVAARKYYAWSTNASEVLPGKV